MTIRADQLLVQRGHAASRTQAQRLIEAGRAFADGVAIGRCAQPLPEHAALAVAPGEADRYVSRGGVKLAGALSRTGVQAAGRVALDVGQSTGGFTDCLLQAGAAGVLGVDVGHGQLHARLAADARVVALEGVNARGLSLASLRDLVSKNARAAQGASLFDPALRDGFGLIVADLSFISLGTVLPAIVSCAAPQADLLLLVKPQFEAGPGRVGKGGIVRDAAVRADVLARVQVRVQACGLRVAACFDSPIAGGDGNQEFFLHAQRPARAQSTHPTP